MRSQSGQVNVQKRKSSPTRWVFWIMKMSSSPTPLSEAIAPPPSRRPSAGGFVLSLGLSWTMTTLRSSEYLSGSLNPCLACLSDHPLWQTLPAHHPFSQHVKG